MAAEPPGTGGRWGPPSPVLTRFSSYLRPAEEPPILQKRRVMLLSCLTPAIDIAAGKPLGVGGLLPVRPVSPCALWRSSDVFLYHTLYRNGSSAALPSPSPSRHMGDEFVKLVRCVRRCFSSRLGCV